MKKIKQKLKDKSFIYNLLKLGYSTALKAIAGIMYLLFFTLKLRENRVLFLSWNGSSYSCNPKSITEYMLNDDYKWDIYWAFEKPDKIDVPENVVKIKLKSIKYYYILFTSKFIVNNVRFNFVGYPFKKKGQFYIQTWHGTGPKCIEKDAEKSLSKNYIREAKKDSLKTDILISGSEYLSKVFKRSYYYIDKIGIIAEYGTPRNDIFFSKDNIRISLCKKYNLPHDKKILLYAPTFRNCDAYDYKLNYKDILSKFESNTGDQWQIVLKLHPNVCSDQIESQVPYVSDLTNVGDIQELLLIADTLITDYSSLSFDFALQNKPVFLFCKDYEQYERNFYLNIKELPFLFSQNMNELILNISIFDEEIYLKKLKFFFAETICSKETGNSSEKIVNLIKEIVRHEKNN